MEGEHQVTIHFFHGQQTEDGKSWLERFGYYVRYRTLNEQKQSDVFPVLMKDASTKWFSSLPQDSMATIVQAVSQLTLELETMKLAQVNAATPRQLQFYKWNIISLNFQI